MKRISMQFSKYFLIALFWIYGCNSGTPRPINYGEDGCYYCKMTVVDKIHGAEIITNKGKTSTFDALECMINYIQTDGSVHHALYLTNIYEEPGTLYDATNAIFLKSENLPSPMGGNLTAFKSKEVAQQVLNDKKGKLYSWDEIMNESHNPVRH